MRKIIYICSLLFLYAVATYAQNTTVTIGSVLASTAGQKITVPINVTNFNDVGSVTLFIQYDATAVTYDSSNAGSEYLINASGGQIAIARAELTAATPVNGKLFDLIFTYHSGASPMAFTAASQLSSTNGVVIPGVVFSSGGIFPRLHRQSLLEILL